MPITRVSYGYSGCITNHKQQLQAQEYIKDGVEVFILSSRDDITPLELTADLLGVSHDNIFATGDVDVKIQKIIDLKTDIHYDTNPYVLDGVGNIGEEVIPAEMKTLDVKYI